MSQRRYALSGIWNSLDCFWVNNPQKIKEAGQKIYQLKIAKEIGFEIPDTLITTNHKRAKAFYLANKKKNTETITKTLMETAITYRKRVFGIYTNKIKAEDFKNPGEINLVPSFFQEYISKKIELRITVIGKKVFAAEIHSQKSQKTKEDWRRYDFKNVPHYPCKLPKNIEIKCIKLVKYLGLQFGAIDMIVTPKNKYIFLEINPNGQWGWIELLTGLPLSKALTNLLIKGGNI